MDPMTRDTLLRHWQMLKSIPRAPRKIAAPALVEKLKSEGYEVSLRTVQRDLNKLSTVLPLVSDQAKPQGWSWQADAPQLNLPALDPQTALVFHLVDRYLRPLLPTATLAAIAPWLKSADAVLDATGNGLAAWRTKVRMLPPGQPLLPPKLDPAIQTTVTEALLQGRQLDLVYRPRGEAQGKHYRFSPHGLVVRNHLFYLVGALWQYDNAVQLLMHRIQSATLTDQALHPLPDFDLDAYIKSGEFGWPQGEAIELIADFDAYSAQTLIERPLAEDQRVEMIDQETVRIHATVLNTFELRSWLLSFGAAVNVIGPPTLRAALAEEADKMVKGYRRKAKA